MSSFFVTECYRLIYSPMPLQQESVIIRVDKAMTARALVRILYSQGWIHSIRLYVWLLQVKGLSSQLKAGIYQVQAGESAVHLLKRIVAGDVLRQSFLIRPGTTLEQVKKDLMVAPYLDYQAADWSVMPATYALAEGLLLADTYVYEAGSSGKNLIQRAHAHLEDVLHHVWQMRAPSLPYHTPYELLIVASILEKESALPADRRLISGVIVNRLKKSMPLQMDPTVIYALGVLYQEPLNHEQMAYDSPYNTYRYRGLPPTPITTVSVDALEAAAQPTVSNYLYFVAKGDGSHEFNATYTEHRKAIARYMKGPI